MTRFYSPYINRFLQPDSIISSPSNPQSWNRFGYVLNNPIQYNDPTGHVCSDPEDPTPSCENAGRNGTRVGNNILRGGGNNGSRGGGGVREGNQYTPTNDPEGELNTDADGDACGQSGYYSPQCPGWHFYTTNNIVCPAELNCTEAEMLEYFLRFAYPGQDPSQPVLSGHGYSVGIPYTHISMGPWGAIVVDVSEDGFTSTNTTGFSHMLYDGTVTRHLTQRANGAWQVTTWGYGNNVQINTPSELSYGYSQMGSPMPGLSHTEGQMSLASINSWKGVGIFNDLDQEMLAYIVDEH